MARVASILDVFWEKMAPGTFAPDVAGDAYNPNEASERIEGAGMTGKQLERRPYVDALDTETQAFVAERTERIRTRISRAREDMVSIGADLLAVRERLGHGLFLSWLNAEFDMSKSTAYRLMNVAEKFPTVGSLEGVSVNAIYMLAAPSAPEAARQEALAVAESGEAVGPRRARAIIEQHKPATALEEPVAGGEEAAAEAKPATDVGDTDEAMEAMGFRRGPRQSPKREAKKAVAKLRDVARQLAGLADAIEARGRVEEADLLTAADVGAAWTKAKSATVYAANATAGTPTYTSGWGMRRRWNESNPNAPMPE